MHMALRLCRLEELHIWNTMTRAIAYLEHYTWLYHTALHTSSPIHAHGAEAMQVRGIAYLHPVPLGKLCYSGDVAQYGFGIAATAFCGRCQDVKGLLQTHLHCPIAPLICCIHTVHPVNFATSFQHCNNSLMCASQRGAATAVFILKDRIDRTTLQKCKILRSIEQLSGLL